MRYRIPLFGNPSIDVALRNKYIAAFGTACYMSEANTFDCFYKEKEMTSKGKACTDAQMIAEVAGAAPFDKGYECEPVAGTDNWSLQVGSDPANKIYITYEAAPRQTPLVEIDGVPTEVNGPYRNFPNPADLGPGNEFDRPSPVVNEKGETLNQSEWILQVNRNAHGGKIHSDLAGFKFPCKKGCPDICIEPDLLEDPFVPVGTKPNVHHVVPRKDLRCCPWGTNSYKNAAVISAALNWHFTNNDPPVEEVKRLNNAKAYSP
jgi:hypothetical protein